jgi:serine/threonine protein kinase/Flp pilus assembly protein TadD
MAAPDRGAERTQLSADTRVSHTFTGDLEPLSWDTVPVSVEGAGEPVEQQLRIRAAGDFEIGHELGHGGMGVVFEARQRSLDRPVALKTLHPGLREGLAAERFADEAHVLGRLEHPNIVPVHAYGLDEAGRPFLCMKIVRGVEWIRALVPDSDEEALKTDLRVQLRILQRVCEAIAFAHSRGIVHRDIKPANVMIGAFGEVIVTDWGIALELDRRLGRPGLVGTPAYMPPEMAARDEARVGPWTDVYLLGATLYQVLTGVPPHRGETVLEAVEASEAGRIEPPSSRAPDKEIPAELAEIALRALDPDPAKRFASVADFDKAIEDYLQNEASSRLSSEALLELHRCLASVADGSRPASEIYTAFAECVSELGHALSLWPGNRAAADGSLRARLAWAAFAVAQDDPAVAEAQIEPLPADAPDVVEMRGRIAALRASHVADARRRRRLRFSLAAAATIALLAIGIGFQQSRRAQHAEAANEQRRQAMAVADGAAWKPASDQIEIYRRATEANPTWREAYTNLSGAYMLRAWERHVNDPGSGAADLTASAKTVDRLLALHPDDAAALFYRGYAHQMLGEKERALADYRRAAALAPDTHDGLAAATVVAMAEGRMADGARLATAAIESAGDDDDFTHRAICRFVLGDLDGGLADIERAARKDPGAAEYDALAALFLLARGDEHSARERLIAGVRKNPRSPHLFPLLAYLAARRGDQERARALVGQARLRYEENARCYLDLDPVTRSLAQAPPPRDVLGRAFVLEEDLTSLAAARRSQGSLLRERGTRLLARGDHEGALALARRALADDPTDGGARLLRGRCLRHFGFEEAATADLELVPALSPGQSVEAPRVAQAAPGRELH